MERPVEPNGSTPGSATPQEQTQDSFPGLTVFVTKERYTAQDKALTEALLASTRRGSYYACPKCDYVTQDVEQMVNHLAQEINRGLAAIATLFPLTTTTPTRIAWLKQHQPTRPVSQKESND